MRLPRWLIVLMLTASALVMLGLGAWWWVTWPERTAHEFWARLMAEDWDGAGRMIVYADTTTRGGGMGMNLMPDGTIPLSWADVERQPRSWRDVLRGTLAYEAWDNPDWRFVSERGSIILDIQLAISTKQVGEPDWIIFFVDPAFKIFLPNFEDHGLFGILKTQREPINDGTANRGL